MSEWPVDGERATGEPRVDEAVARLDGLAGAPVSEHVAVFEDVHRRLQEVLAGADEPADDPADRPTGPHP